MNQLVYNLSMAVGLGASSLGAGLQWGAAVGCLVFGGLTIALTLISLKVSA